MGHSTARRTGDTERSRKIEKWREKERRGWLNSGLFARSKWRSAVILKFSRWQGVRIGLKNQSGSLFLMITASRPRERELLLLSTDSVSLPPTANPPRLSSLYLSASSASIRLSLPHFVSLFPFPLVHQSAPTFSISFHTTRRDASLLCNASLPICLSLGLRYRHTTIANAYTKGHFVDRFKYGRCMRAKPFSRSRI